MAVKRSPQITFRLREDSYKKFITLHTHRIDNKLHYAKCDILSDAVDLLYKNTKELMYKGESK